MAVKKTALIILQYNNWKDTVNCIESVERFNTAPIKYIIVDNGSTIDGTTEGLSAYINSTFNDRFIEVGDNYNAIKSLPYVTFLKSAKNDGYACGNNKGLALAYNDDEVDNILILNNDILFVEDIIPSLLHDVDNMDRCGLVSPLLYKRGLTDIDRNCARKEARFRDMVLFYLLILRFPTCIKRRSLISIEPDTGIKEVQLISGSCIMCRKEIFRHIGSFDPHTFLYYEENILWEKIKAAQLKNYINTGIKCVHLGASTISKSISPALIKATFRSNNYFVRTYHDHGASKTAVLRALQTWTMAVLRLRNIFRWRGLK